ncbi:MAG: MOSC domain-containing protein [Acetobacteraceae bacterium]|nr:MOSC domain-containing protein [Acetobacteraceae bacterium]MCX7684775.1 MOSC domain-containing protein [Acetobacteraceae bacterium]MDW8399226.1 MOSC domain-containing protein [Acetobacteraceae bacterium]
MRVERIYRYPVKGLSPESLEQVVLEPGETLPQDRRFALAQGDAPFDPASPRFLPKQNFACLMANPRLALVHSAYDARADVLLLRAPGLPPLATGIGTPAGKAAAAAWLARFLGPEARGEPRLVEAAGHAFTDQARKGVSLLNLASVAAAERAIGRPLDPLRFRANILFSGLPAWAEFDWIGQELLVGGARLAVFKRTLRCPATEVNPATGERDIPLPALLRRHFGHADLGVHATVAEGGRVAVGDSIEMTSPA